MIALIARPALSPRTPDKLRLTDKQTIAANTRLEAFVHETNPFTYSRALRDVNLQLTIVKTSPELARFPDIIAFRK